MKKITLILLLCLIGIQLQAQKKKLDVFILMGQSNMAGYAPLEKDDSAIVSNIYYLPTIYNGKLAWKPAHHPLHNRLKDSDRFGLGIDFAKDYMKAHPKKKVGLVPLAYGGAPIDKLNKGSEVYNDFLTKLKFIKSKGGKVKGILWHQGESDTVTDSLTNTYEQKLRKLIADIRHDVGNENLPFVIGNLAEFYGNLYVKSDPARVERIKEVKNILRKVATTTPNAAFVESSGCTSFDQYDVHFDHKSYVILAKRYAAEMNKLVK